MPLLFSYGTLQDPAVQLATFGRHLDGHPDELVGFAPSTVPITDPDTIATTGKTHHANALFTGNPTHRLRGTAFDVTDAELAAADAYELPANYHRIPTVLASGQHAWLYVSRSN